MRHVGTVVIALCTAILCFLLTCIHRTEIFFEGDFIVQNHTVHLDVEIKFTNDTCEEQKTLQVPTQKGNFNYATLCNRIYKSLGFQSCCTTLNSTLWLPLAKNVQCSSIFETFVTISSRPKLRAAPKSIPKHLRKDFTLGGFIPVYSWHHPYNKMHAVDQITWSRNLIQEFMRRAQARDSFSYAEDTAGVYHAFERFYTIFPNANALVIGSETPWLEAILLSFGVQSILTAEYASITSEHPEISVVSPLTMAKNWQQYANKFDIAASFSSLEHAGLGRYTDALCAECDFLEMQKISCLVKPGGILFLGIPVGLDQIIFNAHRVYGLLRLPLMTANWNLLAFYWRRWNLIDLPKEEAYSFFQRKRKIQGVMVLENVACRQCV